MFLRLSTKNSICSQYLFKLSQTPLYISNISSTINVLKSNQASKCRYFTSSYFDSSYDDYSEPYSSSSSNNNNSTTSFDYDIDIEIPIISSNITTTITNINKNFNNNLNNNIIKNQNKSTTCSTKTAEKLPKKIRITKSTTTKLSPPLSFVNNNNNNNNVNTQITTTTTTTTPTINIKKNKLKNNSNDSNNNSNSEDIEILNNLKKHHNSIVEKSNAVKTIFDSIDLNDKIQNDDSDNVDSQNSVELEDSLTSEQQKVVNLIVDGGKNVFFTGSAGTGKSFVLKHLVSKLRKKYPKSVFVTAATGIAAVNIGGTTLHSFAGIKLGQGTAQRLSVEILQSKKLTQKWLDCRVLIIDEISMIDSELFEKLDTIGQLVRGSNQPFGGIQLVLVGDFFQLPPVYGTYAFECRAWKKSVNLCVELTTVMRQKETEFIDILNKVRVGNINDQTVNSLMARCNRPLDVGNGVLPTKLYSTNASVDEENQLSLDRLEGEPYQFQALDSGNKELLEQLDRDCPAMKNLTLKVGAQVVLLRKLEKTKSGENALVNGSRGVVVDFVKVKGSRKHGKFYKQNNQFAPVVQFNDGQRVTVPPSEWAVWSEDKAHRLQIPLKLAWALTIHRAQGMTLDKVECELSRTFASGQGYVALSRVKSLNGLYLKDLKLSALKTSTKVVSFNKKIIRSINNSHI